MEGLDSAVVYWFLALIIYVLVPTLFAVPMARVFVRAGFSWAWSLTCFVPFIGFVVPWVLLLAWRWTWREV